MKNKKTVKLNNVFYTKEVLFLVILTCIVSVFVGHSINKVKYYNNSNSVENINDDALNKFIKNYNYIIENYYEDIDSDILIDGAIEGMLSKLDDDYSYSLEGTSAEKFNTKLAGKYDGIGIQVYKYDGNIYIIQVFEDSPSMNAGLMVGDIIKKVDEIEFDDVNELSNYIKDKENFNVTVLRDENEQNINISKSNVVIPSIYGDIYQSNDKKIGYIYISIFSNTTVEQFKKTLEKLEKENIDSLIIDVRDNSGGHLTTVVSILSDIVDKTHLIYQTDTKGSIKKFYSKGTSTKTYPIVVLQNSNSASASELLSIALKETYGATIIGEKSFGKGTVQELINDGDTEYKITTKKWLSPNGNSINKEGVKPDIEVELSDEYFENPSDENDNQLNEAIKFLSE